MSDVADLWYAFINGVVWSLTNVFQLVGNILAVNYRLVTTVGQIATNIYYTLAVLLASVIHAFWETVCYLGLGIVIFITWLYSGISFAWHCCTLLCQIVYSTLSAVTASFVYIIQEILRLGRVSCTWLTNPMSLQDVLETVHSSFITIWTLGIRAIAQFLKSCNHQIHLVLCTITSTVGDLVTDTIEVSTNVIIDLSCACIYGVEISFEWLIAVLHSCGLMLKSSILHICEVLCIYATPAALLSISCLLTISMVLIKSKRALQWLGHLGHSQDVEVAIHDFNDAVEISDEEQNQFDIQDDVDMFTFHNNDDDDDNDESVDTLVTDHSDSDNDDEEEVPNDEDSDVDFLSSTDSNDADDDSDDSDNISIQLPQRSTQENISHMESRDGFAVDNSQCEVEQERSLCVICQDRIKSVLVLPCRHLCMCVDCAHTIAVGIPGQRRTCPLCRSSIRTIMNIYT